jgi:large subunit ribosomal protein L29
MEAREIQPLTVAEIETRLHGVQEEMFNLRFQLSVGQLENFNRLTQLKRDIARLKTELRKRELAAESAR